MRNEEFEFHHNQHIFMGHCLPHHFQTNISDYGRLHENNDSKRKRLRQNSDFYK